ncbi:MAG TPA: restriction endonuclease [Chitinophagales bacterium]|nr:restriction endonuclease [Chitinophagales bacterium]
MIKSEEVNSIAYSISIEIISTFKPTIVAANINDYIENFEPIKKNALVISGQDQKRILVKLKRILKEHIEYRSTKGSLSKFFFSTTDDDFIVGISNIDNKFEVFPEVSRHMSSMTDNDFEKFSGKFIQLHFCDFAFVSRKSKDGGIDFIGNGTFKKLLNLAGQSVDLKMNNLLFRMIGQSKRYKTTNHIGPKEIREFLGSVKILQDSINPSRENSWYGQKDVLTKIRMADPFVYTFLTTSYYTVTAVDLANSLGIYIYDLDDIIFDLIENSIGLDGGKFNSAKFKSWYNS